MNESRFVKSEAYLGKLRQTEAGVSDQEVQDSVARLAGPFQEVAYKETDAVAIETEKLRLSFSYSSLDDETKKKMEQLFTDSGRRGMNTDDLRQLDGFELSSLKDQNFRLELADLLPSDYKVVFLTSSFGVDGFASPTSKIVYVGARAETPLSIATLLHELGHVDDFKEMEKAGIDPTEPLTENGVVKEVEILRRERVANAFAIKKLRPFIRAGIFVKDDVINFLKYRAQKSHDVFIGSAVAAKRSMGHFARDIGYDLESFDREEEEREMREVFEEWQKTDEYREWKKMPAYKDLADYEEFHSWWNWQKSINNVSGV